MADTAREYSIDGMDCADCALKIEKGVRQLRGVRDVRVDFATAKLHVDGAVSADSVRERAQALGYRLIESRGSLLHAPRPTLHAPLGFGHYLLGRIETRLALVGGGVILLAFLLGSMQIIGETVQDVLYAAALALAGYPIARSGLGNLIVNRDFNINLLMTIAAVGAFIIGETTEAATMIFLFAIAEALEGYTADRARDSLRQLMELAPAQAIRLSAGREESVPVDALRVNDMILVKPGERIPMDGVVTAGASDVNQAPITGESLPVRKGVSEEVFAGTVNGGGALEVRVTHLAQDNTLSRIIRLVEEAQSVRAPSQRFIDQFARVYTPAMVLLAVLVAFLPPLLFQAPLLDTPDGHGWLYRALALLVIACPCALVISAPVTMISAITAAARRGVLVKGGAYLEALGQVKVFAFDKTGTLTRGAPVVTAYRSVDCETGGECVLCDDVLALASALERRSAHPIAHSVVAAAEQRGLAGAYAPAEDVAMQAGSGVQGRVNGRLATLGNHHLFDADHPHNERLCEWVESAEADGQTTMLLCDGDRVRGYIAVADEVREDSRRAIADLRALGLETVMLTGDNAIVAQAVGHSVGVDDVRAGLMPEDKLEAINEMEARREGVAMVGDGVNDTPALAAATVGVAMGGAGSAQALETADVALMADSLYELPFAVRLSRFTRRLIAENVTISIGVKLVFMLLALAGLASLWMAVLADMGVSLLVTLNGMRPLAFSARRSQETNHGLHGH
ncbi:MAG TPA: heavy metal translocating P-type ATPase [Anaerolineae bacterium]|nr:heavy metal translocating P-type ATPase [Anaerolineae bacterium]